MATATITIPKPVLPPGGKFTIRYRVVGTTTWTLHGLEDNDPFVLTVPAYDNYEIEVTESNCPPFIFGPVNIMPPCDCPSVISNELIYVDALTAKIKLRFATPIPSSACGYVFVYTRVGYPDTRTIYPASLTDPFEVFAYPGSNYTWQLYANCCGNQRTLCASGQLNAPTPTCIRIDLDDTGVIGHFATAVPGGFGFVIKFKQSTPLTNPVKVKRNQLTFGAPTTPTCIPDVATDMLTPVPSGDPVYPWQVTVIVTPSSCFQPIYQIDFVDICNNTIPWL